MFTKVEAYLDTQGHIWKTPNEAGLSSLAWMLPNQDYVRVEDAQTFLKSLQANPQVLDWLVKQVKGEEFEIVQTIGTYDNPYQNSCVVCDANLGEDPSSPYCSMVCSEKDQG